MDIYYGVTNYSQLRALPADTNIMISARWLISLPRDSVAFEYAKRFKSVFLDSGAFGAHFYDRGFKFTMDEYIDLVRFMKPNLWSSMDVPCEPHLIPISMSTAERIERTVNDARYLAHHGPPGFVPVIQGWEVGDYLHCADLMESHGLIRLVMGIGSLCRRGSQAEVVAIVRELHRRLPNVKFHAFGIKLNALGYNRGEILNYLHSLDTAAWQFRKRSDGKRVPISCREFPKLFDDYSGKLNSKTAGPYQITMF